MNPYIGIFYGSDTGCTEEVTHELVEYWESGEVKVIECNQLTKADFKEFDFLILGLSTWYDGDLQSDWEDFFDDFKTIDFTGKTVAIYGLGDQIGYGEYFVDGIGILAEEILNNGGHIIGEWSTKGYDFSESKALKNKDFFYGLALDEDNESDLTANRLETWVTAIKKEIEEIKDKNLVKA
ncbi:flavodoxin [Aquimarina rhabdastrellae]